MWKILLDLLLQIYLAVPWLGSQSRGVGFLVSLYCSYDNHHTMSLVGEREARKDGGRFRGLWEERL